MTEKEDYELLGKKVIDYVRTMYCPDQYVGKIRDKDNWQKFYKRTNIFQDQTAKMRTNIPNGNILLLILESPHQDEFDKNGEPIGPANGTTGTNIRKYICDIFGNGYQGYHLILMNAIPFQCSLGVGTEHFRDNVFKTIWAEGGEKFFIDRLTQIIRKNIIIVNCCTKGFDKNMPLYQYVAEAIKENDFKQDIQLDHPAITWNTEKGRDRLREKVNNANLYIGKTPEK